jgi:drug/metabolite transporter superfamily protein YnfA
MATLLTLVSLIAAALLESGGDAAIRLGLTRGPKAWLALGAVLLVLYGFVVNLNRLLDFSTLMGGYIAVFFVVSQVIAIVWLGNTPSPTTLLGGALIVVGGVIVQWGAWHPGTLGR